MSERTPSILVIDNDEGMVAALSARLEHLGYACTTAACGAQGIAAFRHRRPDLVITDLNMPAGDGIALVRSIREISGVPVIVVTGYRDDFRRQLRTLPDVTIVRKPFDPNEIADLIEAELVMSGRPLPVG